MRISYKFLQEYIDCSLSPQALAEKLIMAGLEVNAIEKTGPDLDNCLVGQILEINPHPNADRLTVCKVDVGTEIVTIVCGANNMKAKDKVPVALVGCRLPGDFLIKKSKIRGETSQGMMCSEKELNLSEEASGLMILPADAPIGNAITSYLGLDDIILDLELTPNRGDCFSVRGIIREISALTGEKPKEVHYDFSEEGEKIKDILSIQIDSPDLCPRYAAKVISGVSIGPSPLWLVQRLRSFGLRSVNNVVDVTNFVMMEWGQPLHAFDYDLIQGKKIIVRRAEEKEKLITLDDLERILTSENLVIADSQRPIALAGVMGGANTEVSENTGNILLESAFFDPSSIRRTANIFGLHSEASHRFERGIDPEGTIQSLNRAAQLILQLAGGKAAQGIIDVYPTTIPHRLISLEIVKVKKVLGVDVTEEKIINILQGLNFIVQKIDENKIQVQVPLFRWDVERDVDLIEEIARIYGYHNIPVNLPRNSLSPNKKTKLRDFETKIKIVFSGFGFSEAINYSFISEKVLDDLADLDGAPLERIRLKNPLTEDQNIMRTSLMPGLCKNIAYNLNRQVANIHLFEVGRCFFSSQTTNLPVEKMKLGVIMQGSSAPQSWRGKAVPLSIFDIKGVVDALMETLCITDYAILPNKTKWLGSHQSCTITVKGRLAGFLGKVGKKIIKYFDINQDIYALELDVDALKISENKHVSPLPKYPSVVRDLAIIISEDFSYQELEKSIREMDLKILRKVFLFDVYKGEQIASGKKSFGLSFTYQSLKKTLTDKEVNNVHGKIIELLKKKFQASLRE